MTDDRMNRGDVMTATCLTTEREERERRAALKMWDKRIGELERPLRVHAALLAVAYVLLGLLVYGVFR